ncbi:HdaA/DnaA family protein [Kordiimonas aestuarii]|uniref:HdaA/DnaA family protein n=1 Tax=Kordiimonas aestuarii TaxID=1005925 RepID=UPI0021CF8F46|nr:DnaA/Hda family protein [Kordiimonas aestuarii]
MAEEVSQIPLDLPHKPSFEWEDFVVSSSNEAAFATLDGWPDWPHHAVALVGPKASGKSHLSTAWAKRAGAVRVDISRELDSLPDTRPVLVEGADEADLNEAALFHLFNWTKEAGTSLLLTAKTPPNRWNVDLPDLRSRLATVHVAEIEEPDDHLLMILLVKLFSDRQLQVDLSVISYVLPRIERSFDAAKALVEELDRSALAEKRKITRALAKTCLETGARQ